MFSNKNYFSLFLGHQKIGEVKKKYNFANFLGRMAEKRVTKRLEKVTKKRLFYGTLRCETLRNDPNA